MSQQFKSFVNGVWQLVSAIQSSAGAGDAGKIPALDGAGRLSTTMMPTGVGAETVTVVASEALTAGNFVNVYNNGGTPNVRKSDATTAGKEANGFVLAGVASGASATVYLSGLNTQLTGLTAGRYVISTTPGGVVAIASAPATTGNVVQEIGFAMSATTISFKPQEPVTLA